MSYTRVNPDTVLQASTQAIEFELKRQQTVISLTHQLQADLDKIEVVLKKQGLEITQVTWTLHEDLHLSASINAKSTGKFKFMQFAGYTSTGAGRNAKQLQAKAAKLETAMCESGSLTRFSVNQFSLEIGRVGRLQATTSENKIVLISAHLSLPKEQ